MGPRTDVEFEKMRIASREKITGAALKLFAENGYHPTSIDAVAKAAGVSKGLIYNYFSNKEELLESVLFGTMGDIGRQFEDIIAMDDPKEQLKQTVERMFVMAQQESSYWPLYWSLVMQPALPENIKEEMLGVMRDMISLFERGLHAMKIKNASGEAWLLAAALDGVFMYYVLHPQKCPINKIKKAILDRFGII